MAVTKRRSGDTVYIYEDGQLTKIINENPAHPPKKRAAKKKSAKKK